MTICLLAAAQKACLPASDDAAQLVSGLDTRLAGATKAGMQAAVTRKAEAASADTVKSDPDNPSEHGANGLAGALAGLLALKSGEVRHHSSRSACCSGLQPDGIALSDIRKVVTQHILNSSI